MKKDILSNTLIAMAVVLLASCTSNDPEKLILGTWEGVSRVELIDGSAFPTVIDYENQTVTYDANAWQEKTEEYPIKRTLTLSENGKLTDTFINTKIGVVVRVNEGDYELTENGQELSFFYPTESVDYKVEIQNLTRHKLEIVTTEKHPIGNDGYYLIFVTTTYKR